MVGLEQTSVKFELKFQTYISRKLFLSRIQYFKMTIHSFNDDIYSQRQILLIVKDAALPSHTDGSNIRIAKLLFRSLKFTTGPRGKSW